MKFLTIISIVFAFSYAVNKTSLQQRSTESSLAGVWKVERFAFRVPDSGWSFRTAPYESLYIFSKGYYAYTYVIGSNPRRLFTGDPNKPSDAEKSAAYDSFVANSGTYTFKDSTLILTALLHKNPNEMTGKSLIYKTRFTGTALEMTIFDPPFLPGREWKTVLTRIE